MPIDGQSRGLGLAICRKIYELRNQKGMSKEDLLRRSGLEAYLLDQVEEGERVPALDDLQRIAQALDVQVSDLIGG